MIGFLDLVALHFKNVKDFNMTSYLKKIEDDDDYIYNNFGEFPIEKILPNSELLVEYAKYNIVYHGRECTAICKRLYCYCDYYFIYDFNHQGDDLEVLTINFNNMNEFFGKCFIVYKKDEFYDELFLKGVSVKAVAKFYKKMYPIEGHKLFEKYMTTYYKSLK